MKMHEMFPSNFLKAADLGDEDVCMTISKVTMEKLGQGQDAEVKPIIHFRETEKQFVLNKTNATTIIKIAGSDDTDDWIDKKITLYATEVAFGAEMVLSIRVRLPRPKPLVQANTLKSKITEDGRHVALPQRSPVVQATTKELTTDEDLGIKEENVPF